MLIQRNYIELFQIVVRALRQDYAGAVDKAALDDPNPHTNRMARAMIDGLAFDSTFVFNLNAYLAAFKDRLLRLHIDPAHGYYMPFSRGYFVRRSEEGLFVTRCPHAQKLQPGDEILRLGEFSVSQLANKFGASLYGDGPEREMWSWLLRSYKTCRVRHADGSEEVVEQERVQPPERFENRIERTGEGAVCLHLEDFSTAQNVQSLLSTHHADISGCKKLILDMRRTQGGDEAAVIALLPYLFSTPVRPADVLGRRGLRTLFTERNCELLRERLNAIIDRPGGDEPAWMQEMLAGLEKKAGPGLRDDADDIPGEWQEPLPVHRNGYDVVLLSDTYCRGVAEALLARCHEAGEMTIVGRPSMGELGYCHLITVPLDETFSFTYPISRTADADTYAARGVPVDVYLPWCREEIERDILLQKALEL